MLYYGEIKTRIARTAREVLDIIQRKERAVEMRALRDYPQFSRNSSCIVGDPRRDPKASGREEQRPVPYETNNKDANYDALPKLLSAMIAYLSIPSVSLFRNQSRLIMP